MSECVCGFNPPNDCNPDCERCGLVAAVDRLEAENEQLRKRCHELTDLCDNRLKQRWDDNTEYRAEVERLREALEQIANEENYGLAGDWGDKKKCVWDVARKALRQEGSDDGCN